MHNFFTGGFDKTVRLWSVKDNSTATSECLQSFYSVPDAMAFRSGVLLVGSNRKLLSVDLGHLTAKPSTAHINGNVHHIHIHSQAPNISILEVSFYEDTPTFHSFTFITHRSTIWTIRFKSMMKEYNDHGEEPLIASLVTGVRFRLPRGIQGEPRASPLLSKVMRMVACAYGITAILRCGSNRRLLSIVC